MLEEIAKIAVMSLFSLFALYAEWIIEFVSRVVNCVC